MTKTSVLLIDDDLDLLRLMAAAFVKAGYAVYEADDGRSGMRLFTTMTPDVVVTDIIMPTQEGIETIISMKRARPDLKIVAISGGGHAAPGTFLNIAAGLGADRVVAKPFRLADLVAVVGELLAPGTPVA